MLNFYVVYSDNDIDRPEKWELKCVVKNSEMGTIPEKNERVIMDCNTYSVHRRHFHIENNKADVDILCTPRY